MTTMVQSNRTPAHDARIERYRRSGVKQVGAAGSGRAPSPLPGEFRRPAVKTCPARAPGPLRFIRVLWFLACCIVMLAGQLATRHFQTRAGGLQRGRSLRKGMEDLGGLWIKAGQLLGLRRDIFPEEICDALSELQDLTDGFDISSIRTLFDKEFGRQPEYMFAEFDPVPIASGSVGQVHVALTHQGLKVAVKLQRPYVDHIFQADLRYIRTIVWVLTSLRWLPHARWKEMLWELEQMMTAELDYRFEAANIRRMRKTLRTHKVVAPAVLSQFTTKRILVMEYIEGTFMSDFIRAVVADPGAVAAWCAENDVNPRLAGWRLYQTHTRQVYEDNLFHSDLHPGNIVLLKGGRLALIDFGSIGSIDASSLRKYYMIFQAVAERDFNKVADLFLLLATGLPAIDTGEVKSAIIRVMRMWESRTSVRELPYHEKSLTHAMNEIARVFRKHRIPVAWEFMRVNRAELTLDFSLMYLMPDADYHALIRRYERKAKRRALRQALDYEQIPDYILQAAVARTIPNYWYENVQFDAEWIRKRSLSFEQLPGVSAASFVARAIMLLLAVATTVLSVLLILAYSQLWVSWWLGGRATEVISALFPGLEEQSRAVWAIVIIAALYLGHVVRALRRRIT